MHFSPVGATISLALLLPNILWVALPPTTPAGAKAAARGLPGVAMDRLEAVGRIMCFSTPLVTPFDFQGTTGRAAVATMAVALSLYYVCWARYFRQGRRFEMLYRPLWGIPIPMAIAPVTYLAAAALASGSALMGVGVAMLAVSHLWLSWSIYTEQIGG